ncbi:MAG: electron transport complex subunit E [Gammaproteobacteria bacterium]|nr:electron transport complex subunit E [Gammaproteobacteria bacterium]
MTNSSYTEIGKNGLWSNNVALVQLLGLCPLLAVTNTVVNGLGLGIATTITLLISNTCISMIRKMVRPEVRIPVFVLVIASAVTIIELSMNAWLHDLYRVLGIFIPLIVTNCAIIGRAEAFASKQIVRLAAWDGLMMGLGFTIILCLLGGLREALGQGTLFSHAELMFGAAAKDWVIILIDDYRGFLLAMLPPGAFIGLSLIIAVKNRINAQQEKQRTAVIVQAHTESIS